MSLKLTVKICQTCCLIVLLYHFIFFLVIMIACTIGILNTSLVIMKVLNSRLENGLLSQTAGRHRFMIGAQEIDFAKIE